MLGTCSSQSGHYHFLLQQKLTEFFPLFTVIVDDLSRGRPKGSLFDSYDTEM